MVAKLAILSLCIACALGQTVGLSVSQRSASPDETRVTDQEDNGDSRSLYSKNRISPHRMMHFGKRPAVSYPSSGLLELNSGQEHQRLSQRSVGRTAKRFPYTLYFDMAHNRPIEAVYDDEIINNNRREQHLAELIENVLEERRKMLGQQKEKRVSLQPLMDWTFGSRGADSEQNQDSYYKNEHGDFKLMRQVEADGDNAYDLLQPALMFNIHGASNKNRKQSSRLVDGDSTADNDNKEPQAASEVGAAAKRQTNELAAGEQQQGQQQDDPNITIVGRSVAGVPVQVAPGDDDLLSKYMHAQVVNKLLFGRPIAVEQNGSSYRNFMKKAEPQRMTFMHFG